MENITPIEEAYNRYKHLEDMLQYGWTTEDKVLAAKKKYDDMQAEIKTKI